MNKIDLKYIWNLLLTKKKLLIIGQIITIIAILVSVPIPLMLPILVDEVLLNKPDFFVTNINEFLGSGSAFYYIFIVTLAVVCLRLIYYILSIIITKIFTTISKYATFKIRESLISHLKNVSMNEYESLGSGAIGANLITDVNTLDNFIISSASKLVTSVLTLIAVAVVVIAIHPILGLLIIVIQPLIMFLSRNIAKKTGGLKKEENQAIEEFQNSIGESLDLFGQIKASNKEEYFSSLAIQKAKNIQITSNNYNYKSVAYERFSFTLFLIAFEILRAAGLVMVAYSDLSIGMMFAMFGYIWFIMTPVQDILSMQYSYATAMAALKRVNKILNLKQEPNGEQKFEDKKIGVDISLKNLCFSYSENRELLKDISLDIKAGEKIALIGASGSGKTTLAQIIAGFYNKNSGELLYNGIKIEDLDKKSLRSELFLVLQMPILFNNTLRFNITMGDESVSDKSIYKALEIAQLRETVLDMENKLDTVVGKNGVRLSGGQRQRLSIARMIISNPSVVIFDESTSALDVHTELKLFSDLEEILKDKTVITIAHRLSTVKNVDKIYVLDDGKIVQSGSHKELEKENGHYLDFVKNQLVQ
ncbi:ABC transporter ATP-binding protein/permease [Aliarcobacter cryaerophilus]|uniref:ABC transporter ATP-binding protein n=1 Tax=Aliarcobacter cryaerophilus TaxID=28198 RepID=UPI0021B360A9|nr:ABC transporter ATP-binding protein [Aliarcobacter cryaerophilus]MCT7480387.1 ABC transporter ATP-binding protein/permease [Aliarcobacter cryaerophilus]MCT7484733.1 ABC transporter ATP-binding protein/permease [Aliarcobacter cryaerophilus]